MPLLVALPSLTRFPRSSWPTFTRLPSPLCSLHTSRSCNLRLTERKPKGSDRVVTRSVHIGSLNEETRRHNRLSTLQLSVFVSISPHFVACLFLAVSWNRNACVIFRSLFNLDSIARTGCRRQLGTAEELIYVEDFLVYLFFPHRWVIFPKLPRG